VLFLKRDGSDSSSPACAAVLLVMRVYALYFRNRWILFIVALEIAGGLLVACVRVALDDLNACISMFVVEPC
jgi:hypothetical protein